LAYEALFQIYWSKLQDWLNANALDLNVDEEVSKVVDEFSNGAAGYNDKFDAVQELIASFKSTRVKDILNQFDQHHADDSNFTFWRKYMGMVEILLDFTRAMREGNWELHLEALASMLPWMVIYDHRNYGKWGAVYLAEMHNLERRAPKYTMSSKKGTLLSR
jgi:hypothetical protein